jgi:hypothetical protein
MNPLAVRVSEEKKNEKDWSRPRIPGMESGIWQLFDDVIGKLISIKGAFPQSPDS